MAKKSSIEKNNRRAKLARQKAPQRERLKNLARDREAAPEERFEAQLKLAEMPGSVSQACKVMGYSRGRFYRFKELYDKGSELALQEISRRKPCLKNRIEEHIEKAIVEVALEKPAYGQVRVASELAKRGLSISIGT